MSAQNRLSDDERRAQWWHPTATTTDLDSTAAPYRRLALQLQHEFSADGLGCCLMLCTPNRATLASLAGPCLAYALAEELGQRVMLIDASGADGHLSRTMGCDFQLGWSDLLADEARAIEPMVLPTSHPGVSFLPAGTVPDAVSGRHQGAIPRLLERARAQHPFLILSGGSVLHETAALAAAPHVATVMLMPVENETLVADLDAAQKALRLCKARHIGIVMIAGGAPLGRR